MYDFWLSFAPQGSCPLSNLGSGLQMAQTLPALSLLMGDLIVNRG